jgi:2-polyprenyl-6-methoxyphenol hydroxylase-like FAD-dependent oxidoreductase
MTIQALIAGAGPVGMTLAAELARYGVRVRIFDKAAQRTDKSKALVLWSRTLELLDRAGCADSFVAAGHRVQGANIIAAGKLIGHLNMGTVKSPYAYALMLPQSETERLLEAHLNSLGVSVERQVELCSFQGNERGVSAILRHPDGREEATEAEWLVGCDGAHSTVRHGSGMTFLGDSLQSSWILADIHMQGYPFPESEIATYWHEDGVLVFFPIAPGRFRVIADMGGAAGDPTLEQVQAVINRRGPGGITATEPVWMSGFRINERKCGSYRSGRIFVAGDAAHVHSPAGGQGMNTGMQDAFNLAWKLAMVCRKTAAESLLDSYSAERSAVGEQVLHAAGRLTAVATLRNHTAQSLRNFVGHFVLGLAPVRGAMVDTMAEVSIGYPKSPLTGIGARGVAGPVPGERVAPVIGQAPVGSGDTPRFTLFAKAGDAVVALLAKFDDLLDSQIRPAFGSDAIWLVRPDGYTACVAKHADVGAIAGYLESIRQDAVASRPQPDVCGS